MEKVEDSIKPNSYVSRSFLAGMFVLMAALLTNPMAKDVEGSRTDNDQYRTLWKVNNLVFFSVAEYRTRYGHDPVYCLIIFGKSF